MSITLRGMGASGLGLFLFLVGCNGGGDGGSAAPSAEETSGKRLTAAQAKGAQDCLNGVQQCHEADPSAQGMKQCFSEIEGCLSGDNPDFQACFDKAGACFEALPEPTADCADQLAQCLESNNIPAVNLPGIPDANGNPPNVPGGNGCGVPNIPNLPDLTNLPDINGGNANGNIVVDIAISINGQDIEVLQQCIDQVMTQVQTCVEKVKACVGQIQADGQVPACLLEIETCFQGLPALATQCKP